MANLETTTETPKLKFKTVITHTETVEKEVELPYFFRHGDSFYKITEKHAWAVDPSETWARMLRTTMPAHEDQMSKGQPCTEQEFNEAFETTLAKIQNLSL